MASDFANGLNVVGEDFLLAPASAYIVTDSSSADSAERTLEVPDYYLDSTHKFSFKVFIVNGWSQTFTINVSSLGAKAVKIYKAGQKVDLPSSGLAGTALEMFYDGTDFVVIGTSQPVDTVSDSPLPPSAAAVNGALTNYNIDNSKFQNVNLNTIVGEVNRVKEYAIFGNTENNTPSSQNGYLTVYNSETRTRITQIYKSNETSLIWVRVSENGGIWWSDWEQIATKSDLTNYVSQWKGQALENGTDTGININGSYYGKTLIVIWSAQYGAGNDTNSGIDLIRCGFDQNIINVTHITSDINNANFIPYYYVSSNGTLLIASSLNVVYAKIIDNR